MTLNPVAPTSYGGNGLVELSPHWKRVWSV